MSENEKKESIRNIIIIAILALLTVGVSISMFNTFSNGNGAKSNKLKGTSLAELSAAPKHITETPFENFIIDADVKIGVKDNFNIYTAKSYDYDIDKWKNVLFKDKKITEEFTTEFGSNKVFAENGLVLSESVGRVSRMIFSTERSAKRPVSRCFCNGDGVEPLRDKMFPKKDLDFMSCDDAVKLVKDVIDDLDINVSEYNVYSVDYEYMKKYDDKLFESYEAIGFDGEAADVYKHIKDDEFYFITMRAGLPNNGILAEIVYRLPNTPVSINSNDIYAVVCDDGLLSLMCGGVYSVNGESENKYALSLDDAFGVIKDIYKDMILTNEFHIYKIELSYMPYLIDKDKEIFELKPTWLFYMYEDKGVEYGNRYFNEAVDATTGKKVIMQ